jgi:DNA polymerase V
MVAWFTRRLCWLSSAVVCEGLVAAAQVQPSLLGVKDSLRSERLMAALDASNRRFGRGSVVIGLTSGRTRWTQKAEWRTPRYTTRLDEVPVARA